MFDKLKHESLRLQQGWHRYDAFNFLVTAWHLFKDWPNSDDPRALCRMKRQGKRLPHQMNFVLDIVRDLAYGSKHFQLIPDAAAKRWAGEVHTGQEMGFYEYFFHENLPAVTVEDHWYFSIRVLNNIMIRYFEWTFDDSTAVKDFPVELLEAIVYCNMANRGSGPSPAIGCSGSRVRTAIRQTTNLSWSGPPGHITSGCSPRVGRFLPIHRLNFLSLKPRRKYHLKHLNIVTVPQLPVPDMWWLVYA